MWVGLRWAAAVAAGFVLVQSAPAWSADLPVKAPVPVGCIPAVDGVNGKLAGLGGTLNHAGLGALEGSLTAPLGCQFGVQVDAMAASFDGRFLGSIAGHLFWRDPTFALLGIYASHTFWDRFGGVRANHVAGEGEYYFGRFTLKGVVGVEFGNNATETVGPLIQGYDVRTRFYDQVNFSFYPEDNLRAYIGHRYLYGKHAAALGAEWGMPLGGGIMPALFVEGRIGEDDFRGVWGGLRVYFGGKDKTLIRRHREDDPNTWDDGLGIANTGTSACQSNPPVMTEGFTALAAIEDPCAPIILPPPD